MSPEVSIVFALGFFLGVIFTFANRIEEYFSRRRSKSARGYCARYRERGVEGCMSCAVFDKCRIARISS